MNKTDAAIAAEIERINKLADNTIKIFRVGEDFIQLEKIAKALKLPKETEEALEKLALAGDNFKALIKDLKERSEKIDDALKKSTQYSPMLQGKGTNALAHASQKNAAFDQITGIANIETPSQVLIKIEKFADRNLNVQTRQLLDILTLKMTAVMPHAPTAEQVKEHRVVTLTVDEFMKWRGLKDKKEARKQLEEAARNLYNISLEWDEEHLIIQSGKRKPKETIRHHRMRITDNTISDFEKPIKDGTIAFKFSFDLAEYLGNAYIMQYPHALFTINPHKNPHSYYMGRKLALHYNMNVGKENSNRISVKNLLEALPDMPKYDEVMSKDRHTGRKIIDTFERDLDALIEQFFLRKWEYCNSGGVPLTDEQLKSYSYEVWVSWLVSFELANYPDQTERLKEIERRKKIAAKKTEK